MPLIPVRVKLEANVFLHTVVCAALTGGWSLGLYGQETVTTAAIAGQVTDRTGAAVARAVVTATEEATNQSRVAGTGERGQFRLGYLAVGRYVVTVRAAGFREASRTVELTVGSAFAVPFVLELSGVAATVTVTGEAPVVEASRSQIAATVGEVEAQELPFNGRNAFDLALLAPGVSATNTASVQTFAETSPVVGQGYSVNSQRNFSNGFIVDGLSANDDAAGLAGNSYGLDVIREFQVVTSGGQAEFGRAMEGTSTS